MTRALVTSFTTIVLFCGCPSASDADANSIGNTGGGTTVNGGGPGGGNTCLFACPLSACGDLPDGCGGVLHCGGCPLGETCGGSGVTNVCAVGTCHPTSCLAAGKNCGQLSDGCGALLDCGACPSGMSCGAQTPNVCGSGSCTPKTCAELGKTCGSVNDGCGQRLACGTCGTNETCTSNNVCEQACPRGCPTGYSCDPRGFCTGGPAVFAVNVVSHSVQGLVTVNGVTPTVASAGMPGSPTQLVVLFTNRDTGARSATSIACTGAAGQPCPTSFAIDLFPGRYRVTVFATGLVELPNAPLVAAYQGSYGFEALPDFRVTAPVTGLALDVVTVPTQLTITVNGAAPTNSSATSRNATFVAAHTLTGQLTAVVARCTGNGPQCALTATVRLPPGPHRFIRLSSALLGELPVGADVHLESDVFTVMPGRTSLTVDLAPFSVRGTLTLNGDAGVGATSNFAVIAFTPLDGGSSLEAHLQCTAGARCESTFSTRLFPGSYVVTARADAMQGFPPAGTFVVSPAMNLTASAAPLSIDVPTVRLSGRVTVNGLVPSRQVPLAPLTLLDFELIDTVQPLQRSLVSIDCTDTQQPCTGAFSEVAFRGRAVASVSGINVSEMPPGPAASPATIQVDATSPRTSLVLDVLTTPLEGTVTVNGRPPTLAADAGTTTFAVRLSQPGLGEHATLARPCPSSSAQASCPLSFGTRAFLGSSLSLEASAQGFNELPFATMPRFAWPYGRVFAFDGSLRVAASPTMHSFDLKTARLRGNLTVNGTTPTRAPNATGLPALLQLTNRATGNAVLVGLSCSPTPAPPACAVSFDTIVPPGIYELAVVPQSLLGVSNGPAPRWIIADPLELR